MTQELTPFMREIREIGKRVNPIHFYWYGELKAGDKKYVPLRIISIDIISDFENKFADEIFIEMLFGGGTFSHEIYPKKNDITFTLFRREIEESKEHAKVNKLIERQEMRAVLIDTDSKVIASNDRTTESKDAGDINQLVTVKFQLMDLALEQIRAKSVGGIFRETTGLDVLKYLLTDLSKNLEVDQENEIDGVEAVPANNNETRAQIVVPHGLPFVNLPEYIHKKCGGIYAADFGFYLFRKKWYVYPLYDLTRFKKEDKTLTIMNIPLYKMPNVERTYRVTGNQVILISTGQTIQRDNADIQTLNQGNGVRFTDARQMMSGFSQTSNNTTMALRGDNNHEYLVDERKSGLNNVTTSPNIITSNPFVESSSMAKRRGSRVACVWENSDPTLIYPGMPVRYQFLVNDEVKEALGVVQYTQSHIHNPNPGILNQWHQTNTVIMMFLEANTDWFENSAVK